MLPFLSRFVCRQAAARRLHCVSFVCFPVLALDWRNAARTSLPVHSLLQSLLSFGTVLCAVDCAFPLPAVFPHAPLFAELMRSCAAAVCWPCLSDEESLSPFSAACAARASAQGTRFPAPAAMPTRKKKKQPPKGPQGDEWVQGAAEAFDAAHRNLPAGGLPSAEDVAARVRQVAPPVVGGGSSSSAGAAEVPYSQARLGSLMLHRHSGEGLLATGFEPERHSVMVLGRPVQASPPSAASEGCDGCFIFCVSCHPPHARRPLRVAPILSRAMLCSCFPLRSTM